MKILQNTIGKDGVIFYIIHYSDATQLNNFGTKKAWHSYFWLGNIPVHTRLSTSQVGRAVLLASLPQVMFYALNN